MARIISDTLGYLKHLHRTSRYDIGLLGDAFLVGATAGGHIGQPKAPQTAR